MAITIIRDEGNKGGDSVEKASNRDDETVSTAEPAEQILDETKTAEEHGNPPEVEIVLDATEINSADDEEVAELRQQLLRAHADFDNFRKRTRLEKEDLQRFATKALFSDLLPIADNFERAMTSMAEAPDSVRTGVEMVHRQLLQVFQKNGVEVLNPVGQAFDPNLHEAVMQEPAEEGIAPGTVVQVFQPGYVLNGKMLRPAMVKVTV
jgi:molecular chaperone GrpE